MKAHKQAICCILLFFAFMPFCQALPSEFFGTNNLVQECFSSPSPLALSANDFGASLMQNLEERGNVFISPFSIYATLAMAYLGAKGQTAEELERAFLLTNRGIEKTDFHKSFRKLLNIITSENNEYNLQLANGIFVQQDSNIEDKYLEDIRKFYRATLKIVDFAIGPKAAIEQINKFVSESTHNMIDEFLKEPLSRDTVLALLNAVYFKGTWKIQFPTEATTEGIFHTGPGTTKKVKYMRLDEEKFRFFEDNDNQYKFLELPYKGGDISMLLALPNYHEQLPNIEMDSEYLCHINKSLTLTELGRVWLPKFQLRYTKELVGILRQLGIQELFGDADLSGIQKKGDISVSTVLHEAVIDVNEEGSEASAATGAVVEDMLPMIPPPEFVANHPFSFYIVDNRSGIILFSGRLFDP